MISTELTVERLRKAFWAMVHFFRPNGGHPMPEPVLLPSPPLEPFPQPKPQPPRPKSVLEGLPEPSPDVDPLPPPFDGPEPAPPRAGGDPAAPAVERKPRDNLAVLRNELAETVTELIEQIASPKMAHMRDRQGVHEYEEALSHLIGCDFHFVDELTERMNGGSQWVCLSPHDPELRELMWPIDIAAVSYNDRNELHFSRLFTATTASLRGQAKIIPQRAAWLVNSNVSPDGQWFAQMSPIGLINGNWTAIDRGMVRQAKGGTTELVKINSQKLRKETNDTASILQSVALTERYNWHVAIGQENGPRVLLPTNPKGCLALFKTREKREGETRRAALRHWVSNHFRDTGDREIAYVRDHLRGTTEFNWRGFNNCEVFVSEFDLEKNELFKQQAAEWRSRRKHNRVVVRIKREKPARL